MVAALWHILSHYLNHPLGRRDRRGTLVRFIRWQIGSRALGAAVAIPFVNDLRILVQTGMHGATGNIYVGLADFDDMAFTLHFLREGDGFIDVGANVGIYSLLAAERRANVLALEPVHDTYEHLLDNINLNRLNARVDAKNIGAGGVQGELRFSMSSGPTNHVLTENEGADDAVSVSVDTLDRIATAMRPTMIKIDVEGFEAEVLRGAASLLSSDSLHAVLIELNGLGVRYGAKDADVHLQLIAFGFRPISYEPVSRCLAPLDDYKGTGNTLYVRSLSETGKRVKDADAFVWRGISI